MACFCGVYILLRKYIQISADTSSATQKLYRQLNVALMFSILLPTLVCITSVSVYFGFFEYPNMITLGDYKRQPIYGYLSPIAMFLAQHSLTYLAANYYMYCCVLVWCIQQLEHKFQMTKVTNARDIKGFQVVKTSSKRT